MPTATLLLLATVLVLSVVHLPSSVVMSMETENGYLCNLCHSLNNDHPYPPPSAEDFIVRFTQSQTEEFGFPWERGSTCIEVWDTVLDYANAKIIDESSCRRMAAAYAPQCCNDIDIVDVNDEQQQQQDIAIGASTAGEEVIPTVRNENTSEMKTTSTQRLSSRENHSSVASGRDDGNNNDRQSRIATNSHLRGQR